MNKYVLAAIAAIALPSIAGAQYVGPSNQTVISVAEAKKLADDTNVILEGKVEKHLRGDKYLFSDSTGSITVEIESEEWKNISVSEKDKVRIKGEVDTSYFHDPKIDVDSIRKVK